MQAVVQVNVCWRISIGGSAGWFLMSADQLTVKGSFLERVQLPNHKGSDTVIIVASNGMEKNLVDAGLSVVPLRKIKDNVECLQHVLMGEDEAVDGKAEE